VHDQNIPDGVAVDDFLLSDVTLLSAADSATTVCETDASSAAGLLAGCFCVSDASVLPNSAAPVLPSASAHFIVRQISLSYFTDAIKIFSIANHFAAMTH